MCMYKYIYIHIYICIHANVYKHVVIIYICMYAYVCVYIYIYTYIYLYIYVHMCIFLCIHMNIYVQKYSAYLCTAMRTRSSNVMALDMFATMSRMEAASKIARSAWSSHGCVHFIHQRRSRSYVYICIWVSFHLHVCLFCIENGGCKQDGAVCVIFGKAASFAQYSMTHFTCLFALQHTATHCNTLQHTAP